MALDPAFGAHGQAAAGVRSGSRWRGRPKNQDAYPIYPCQDGYVRLCVMAPRQWRGLRRWLGEPEDFQDPKYEAIGARFAAWPQISMLVEAMFAGTDHEGTGGCRAGTRGAHRRGAHPRAHPGVRAFP